MISLCLILCYCTFQSSFSNINNFTGRSFRRSSFRLNVSEHQFGIIRVTSLCNIKPFTFYSSFHISFSPPYTPKSSFPFQTVWSKPNMCLVFLHQKRVNRNTTDFATKLQKNNYLTQSYRYTECTAFGNSSRGACSKE